MRLHPLLFLLLATGRDTDGDRAAQKLQPGRPAVPAEIEAGFRLDEAWVEVAPRIRMHRDGTHYQLTGLKRPFVVGEHVGLQLVLLNGMRFHVELEVRDAPPPAPSAPAPRPPKTSSMERLT